MDPVGTPIGAVSLLFQVFSGCVMAYQLLSDARGLEKNYQFFLVRFKTEQYRLLDWALAAKVSEKEDISLINDINRSVIIGALDEQYRLMLRFGRLDERLQPLTKPLLKEETRVLSGQERSEIPEPPETSHPQFPETNGLLRKALAFADSTSKYPLRLRWVLFDRSKVEGLLSRLNSLNNFLRELLDAHQKENLRLNEARTHYQIVQLNTKVDQLYEIVQAGFGSLHNRDQTLKYQLDGLTYMMDSTTTGGQNKFGMPLEHLICLAKFKTLTFAASGSGGNENGGNENGGIREEMGLTSAGEDGGSFKLEENDITFGGDAHRDLLEKRRTSACYKPKNSKHQSHKVWIEWKSMPPQHYYDPSAGPEPAVFRRFEALVDLLRQNQETIRLRAPPCLGYCIYSHFGPTLRYGLVFQNPPGIDPDLESISLRQQLDYPEGKIPSLTDRVALMRTLTQCVERLHAVNWLHKGLRSENVIFFARDIDHVDESEPYLAGFDYSRPVSAASMSEGPGVDLMEDLYRHPSVQGEPTEGVHGARFRKYHDLYSLGVVLLEVAYWKPVEAILGILDIGHLRVKDVLRARETLLDGGHRDWLTSHLGNTISGVIMACIEGPSGLGMSNHDTEEDGIGGAKLQSHFYDVVVRPLMDIRI